MSRLRLSGKTRRVKLTFMDCDGVIFDSNPAKSAAFRQALSDHPDDAVARFMEHHTTVGGGVSRYEKLRWFFEKVRPVDDLDAAMTEALARFSEASRAAYAELQPRPEALTFAERMGGPDRVHVVSGSDQDELREVFAQHGLTERFAGVHGSPAGKVEHMQRILQERDLEPGDALLLGDGGGDLAAATKLRIPFVFLAEMSEWAGGNKAVKKAPGDVHHVKSWELLVARTSVAPTPSTKERKALKGKGHHLEPVVQIGQRGLTEAVLDQIDAALDHHELIKVRIGKNAPDHDVAKAIERDVACACVQRIGRVGLFYRPAERL